MNRRQSLGFVAAAMLLCIAPLMAQQKRPSPMDVTDSVIDGNRVIVFYSRPHTKSPTTGEVRKIWGGLIPYGKVWRTGANEATLLVTQQPITIGGLAVPAGAHTLFTLPAEDGSAKLIINKQIGQWGLQYHDDQDLGRVDMTKATLDQSVDQFTMSIEKNPDGGGILKMMWENLQYSVAFTVNK